MVNKKQLIDCVKHFIVQLGISADQLLNVLLSAPFPWAWKNTWADETMSSRTYRAWRDGKLTGKILLPVIDFLFKWQKLMPNTYGHCHSAYTKEKQRYNFPPEMR